MTSPGTVAAVPGALSCGQLAQRQPYSSPCPDTSTIVFVAQIDLVSAGDIAEMLSISKQRIDQLARANKMPEPVAVVASGRIWLRDDIVEWARETGRLDS